MGQAESIAAASSPNDLPQSQNSSPDSPSMESLIAGLICEPPAARLKWIRLIIMLPPRTAAGQSSFNIKLANNIQEAEAYGNEANESPDAKAKRALECPCIADLRKGPCGVQFSDAFLCFFKSTAEEKGSDCVHPFVALQSCIKANPNAFAKDIMDDEEEEEKERENENEKAEEAAQDYRIIPPSWSKEPQTPKSKL